MDIITAEEIKTVTLKCLFCGTKLENTTNSEPESGDMIKCQNCKELNDYDALVELIADQEEQLISDKIDDIFK
ncbi:MAG: DNA-directed RNA polymerase subunit RPC12/RpoP [Colwellia sp.]|jgi:DNA-directed RNA polymerase subunit RPC12/RpoP